MDEFLPKTHQSCASGVHWSDQFAPRGALDGRACDEYARTHRRGAPARRTAKTGGRGPARMRTRAQATAAGP